MTNIEKIETSSSSEDRPQEKKSPRTQVYACVRGTLIGAENPDQLRRRVAAFHADEAWWMVE